MPHPPGEDAAARRAALHRARASALLRAVGTPGARVVAWLETHGWDEGAVLMLFGALIGLAAGLGAVVFYHLIDGAYTVFIRWIGGRLGIAEHPLYRPILTAVGLWSAWALVRRTRIPDGQNVADVQLAVAKRGGRVPVRPVLVRTLAAAITLGSGGSAGSEGPVAVLGAASGSALGGTLRVHPRRRKILVGCGAAAGISAAFNAPFAGAFFALEEVLGSFSTGAFGPVVVASVVGALIVRPFLGENPAFRIPSYAGISASTIVLLYPLLGIACGLWSALYTRLFFATAARMARLRGAAWLRPILGGLFVGAVVFLSRGLLVGNGHLAIPTAVFGGIAWYLLLALALAKTLATAATLGTGGSGGVFTPTLFIGAALGGGLGRLAAALAPGAAIHPQAWGLVGMAGLVAGATRAPLTAIFMVFEMTDDYRLVPPLMLVSVISYYTARQFEPHGLYDGWLARRGEHLAHGADRALMERIRVAEAYDHRALTLPPEATLEAIVRAAGRTRQTTLPVVEGDGTLVGVITYDELRQAMLDRGDLALVLLAADLAEPTEVVTPRESLRDALRKMNTRALDALPVVASESEPRYLGVLTRADLLAAYERQLMYEV